MDVISAVRARPVPPAWRCGAASWAAASPYRPIEGPQALTPKTETLAIHDATNVGTQSLVDYEFVNRRSQAFHDAFAEMSSQNCHPEA
jgi:hypothetical protein